MKHKLRQKHLKKRKELPDFEKNQEHKHILEQIKNHKDISSGSHIMVYISMPDEVETRGIIRYLLEKEKKVYVPVVEGSDIKASQVGSIEDLVPGKFGIPEPPAQKRKYTDPGNLDVVIVPGVCFDEEGLRLGRGGGYYDRFLKKVRKNAKVIGLCYRSQLESKIPKFEHDQKVDEVIFR